MWIEWLKVWNESINGEGKKEKRKESESKKWESERNEEEDRRKWKKIINGKFILLKWVICWFGE